MKKINLYIAKQLSLGFILILLGMTGLIWLSQSLKMIDWIVNKGVSVNLFIELTLLVLPNFIVIITPIAFFIVLLFVYSRLLADRELVVMKAAGMGAIDLARPALYTGVLLVFLGYLMSLWIVPCSVSQFKELQFRIRNNLAQVAIQEGEFNQLPNQMTVYVRVFKPNGELEGILIHDDSRPEKRVVMVAKNGLYIMGEGQARIIMHQGTRQEYNRKTGAFTSLSFEQNTMTFEESKKNKVRTLGEEEQSLGRLLTVKKDELEPLKYREYKVEAFRRLTQPLYALTYMFVGLLALLLGHYNRRGQSGRIYLAVAAIVILQSLALGFENLSKKNLFFLSFMLLNVLWPIIAGIIILRRGYFTKENSKIMQFFGRFITVILLCLLPFATQAAPEFVSDTEIYKNDPVDFEADTISYDKKNAIVTATGNVIVRQHGTVLEADKLIYNQKKETGEVIGHVVLTRPDGVKLKSEKMLLSDAFNQADLQGVLLTFADGSTFKARQVIRLDGGNKSEFKKAFFTPCSYCEGENPLWNLEASTVEHNYQEKQYTFYNALLDVKGFPVFYWPYLEYPDFQVKRKTGFLAPAFAKSSEMGFGVETPFFWNINNSQDLYLSPIWSTSHFPFVQGRYRGIYNFSKLTADASFTKEKDTDRNEGHIKLDYEADLTDKLRFTGSYYRVTNDSYLRRYHVDNTDKQDPWIQSFGKLEYFGDQSYAYANVMDFESLRRYIKKDSMPLVSQVNYTYTTKPFWNGLYSVSTLNGADVYRETEERSSRMSYQQSFVLPYISNTGFVFENQATARIDGYNVTDEDDKNKNISRLYTNASTKISYPLMYSGEKHSQVVEPIVMAVLSPNTKTKSSIPNEDCVDVFFDDVNLFSANRYNGYDRVETGSRLNYGFQWSLYGQNNMYLSAMIGQSYRFSDTRDKDSQTGFDKHFSAYVGHLNMDFKDFGLGYRFRLNQDTLEHEMSETRFYAGRDPLRISVSYLYLRKDETSENSNDLTDREEIYFRVSSKLTKTWSTYWYYRYDLSKGGGATESGGGVQYDNECLTLLFTVEKDLTRDVDYKGDTSYFMRVVFKTLGGI